MARTGKGREDRSSKPPTGRFTSFTLLTVPINQVLMQIKNEGALTFPGKLKEILVRGPETSTVIFTVIIAMIRLTATT